MQSSNSVLFNQETMLVAQLAKAHAADHGVGRRTPDLRPARPSRARSRLNAHAKAATLHRKCGWAKPHSAFRPSRDSRFPPLDQLLSNDLLSGNALAKGANAAIDVRWNEIAETIVDSMEGNLYRSISPNLHRVASMSAGSMGNLD